MAAVSKQLVYKETGGFYKNVYKDGLKGWLMCTLTSLGLPKPCSREATVYVAKLKQELDQNWHIYQKARRVWPQKPHGKETKV